MATVYLATDLKHERKVALKVLKPELAVVVGADRFLVEIKTTAKLQHPQILPLFDSGEADGLLYYVMPFVDGETLRNKLNREVQLGTEEAVRITSDIADALEYAHRNDVIHRDIKPENILLQRGVALVSDFGISLGTGATVGERLTEGGFSLGTPAYMSPEQINGDRDLDGRSDQYALACVMYEMLAGDPPFVASSSVAVIARQIMDVAPPISTVRPDAQGAIVGALTKALAKSPADRHDSLVEFCGALTANPRMELETRPSIAVLPFANMSPDPDQEYFADAMAAELINALAKVPGLRVIARTSAFAFKGTNADVKTIASRLEVSTVVEGSAQKVGDRVRITVQLIDTASVHHLWSDTYDRPLDDLFDVQDEIVRAVVMSITPKILGEADGPLVVPPTENQKAYDLYLRAGEHLAHISQPNTRRAIAMLDGATTLDPHFADAWARLSGACCLMDAWFAGGHQWQEKTDKALEKALALDSQNAEAHMVQGRVLWTPRNGFRHGEALRALEESLRLQPGSPGARQWHSLILLHVGLMAEAEEGLGEVLAAEPEDATVLQFIAQNMLFQFRLDEAAEYQARTLAAEPGHHFAQIFQPTLLLYQNDLAGAESALRVARQLLKEDPLLDGNEALLWAKRGEPERAEAALARARADRPSVSHSHHAWHYAAAAYAVLGKKDEAILVLRDAAAAGLPNYLLFRDDPHFSEPHVEPDMAELLAELRRDWGGYRRDFGRAL